MTVALVAWWFEVCPTATAQNKLKSDKHTGIVFSVRVLMGDDSKAPTHAKTHACRRLLGGYYSTGHSYPPNEWPRGANDFSASGRVERSTLLRVQEPHCRV